MRLFLSFFISILLFPFNGCQQASASKKSTQILTHPEKSEFEKEEIYKVSIVKDTFYAAYNGPDFYAGEDIAHQLSNYVADTLGKYLKAQYKSGKFTKVDLKNSQIAIISTGKDSSNFTMKMPLIKVSKTDATTCIDHRGSWVNNIQQVEFDLREFLSALKAKGFYDIEKKRFETESGYYEYWIQYKHPALQSE